MFENLSESQERRVRAKLEVMPERFRKRYKTAMQGRERAAAIDSHCYECVGWTTTDLPDGDCGTPDCSLYPFRPFNRRARKEAAKCTLGSAKAGPESTPECKAKGEDHDRN